MPEDEAAAVNSRTDDMPVGVSAALQDFERSPPIFTSRIPEPPNSVQVQFVFVIPFVQFQLPKLVALFFDHWSRFPPCQSNSPAQDADLLIFTEEPLTKATKERIVSFYKDLGQDKIGCFHKPEPRFVTLGADQVLSHLEGAAFAFYELFKLLESDYRVFSLSELDIAPVQSNWLPALVKKSRELECESSQLW